MPLGPPHNGAGHMERGGTGIHAGNDKMGLLAGGLGTGIHHLLQEGHVLLGKDALQLFQPLFIAGQLGAQGEQSALNGVQGGADVRPVGLGIGQTQHGVGLVNGTVGLHPGAVLADPGAAHQAGLSLITGFGI